VAELRKLLACCSLCLLIGGATQAHAQELSYDGKRWYDVEVSIFTNDVPGGTRSEIPVAHKLTTAYLPRLRELTQRSSAFLIEFPEDRIPAAPEVSPPLAPAVAPEVPVAVMGPVYSPALRDSFKITDFDRDPFVDLDTRASQFNSMLRSIEAAPEHRLLWHKVWRQPMQGRAQTSAVFVSGGDRHAGHSELEGSLRLVDNAGGAMLDVNIWLNEFRAGVAAPAATAAPMEEWKIPAFPFPPAEAAPVPETLAWELAAVWQLAQTRELDANELYYLDHPAIGVLIQVRPYLLPPPLVGEQSDF
jgi:hypothetical protein